MSALPVLLALWLATTAISSFVPAGQRLRAAATAANGLAMVAALFYAARLAFGGHAIEDAALSIPVLGVTIWFFLSRRFRLIHERKSEEGVPSHNVFAWRAGAICLLATVAVSASGAIYLGLPPRSNHISYDVRWLAVLGLSASLYGLWGYSTGAIRRLGLVLCLAGVALAGLAFFLDHYNLLVEYERWAGRGLPNRWETPPSR